MLPAPAVGKLWWLIGQLLGCGHWDSTNSSGETNSTTSNGGALAAERPALWRWTMEVKPAAAETPTATPALDNAQVLWQLRVQLLGYVLWMWTLEVKPAAAETPTVTPALDKQKVLW